MGECVLTATYIINRLPTPFLKNKSPFETIYNRPPSLSHLKTLLVAYVMQLLFHPKQKSSLVIPSIKKHTNYLIWMQTLFLQVGMSSSMRVFSHSANSSRCNPHLHHKVFCPLLTLTYPLLSNIHSINLLLLLIRMHLNLHQNQLSSPTRHNTPEPPSNQPSSFTRHNAPELPSNQPSSPTRHNLQ